MNIYCGNNNSHPPLQMGELQIGTRYRCLRKGIGRGFYLPYDPKYTSDYDPIDTRKIYCGDKDNLPEGYDRLGSLHACLQKGVGIGKRKRAEKGPKSILIPITLFLIFSTGLFLSLYYTKPYFIVDTNPVTRDTKINWYKFGGFYGLQVIFLGIIIYYLYMRYR